MVSWFDLFDINPISTGGRGQVEYDKGPDTKLDEIL